MLPVTDFEISMVKWLSDMMKMPVLGILGSVAPKREDDVGCITRSKLNT